MATTGLSAPQWMRQGVDMVEEQFNRNPGEALWRGIAKVIDDNGQLFIRLGTFQTVQVATVTNELEGVNQGDFLSSYIKDYYKYKRSIGVTLSTEAIDRDRKVKGVYKDLPWHIRESIDYAMEYDIANLINLATTITTPDGVAFASASHPIVGGVDSNYTTGAAAIGVIETGLQVIRAQKNQNGDPYRPAMEGYTMWCAPQNEMLLRRLCEAAGYPDTIATGRYNDPNVAKQFINGVRSNPFFSASTPFILLPSNIDRCPLICAIERPANVKVNEVPNVDGIQTLGTSIWTSGAVDYRNTMYFPGS